MNELNPIEKKLATIWRAALHLSQQQEQALNHSSDFHSLLPDWCATFELAKLSKGIRDEFGIEREELRHEITSLDTLGEQAVVIERFLAATNK